jgi:hypothetical protein
MHTSILDLKPLSRIRRNHGLEHATIHMLSKKHPEIPIGGLSSTHGFTIVGDIPTEEVAEAAIEALKKLRAGHKELALHPNCGTNFAVSGAIVGLAAWVSMLGADKKISQKLERLPLVMALATLALILARPLGPAIQQNITTSGVPAGLELERVETSVRAGLRLHRVLTKG